MSAELTQAAARDHLRREFVRTLGALPDELALALFHPDLPRARFHHGVTLPFTDDGGAVTAEFFSISYWVTGTAPDTVDHYLDLVVQCWNQFGWPTKVDPPSSTRGADTRTPDHYELAVQRSANGYLSLSGTTPPFPAGSAPGDPLPDVIKHPN